MLNRVLILLFIVPSARASDCAIGTLTSTKGTLSQKICVEKDSERVQSQNCLSQSCSVRVKLASAVKSDPNLKFKLVELSAGTPGTRLCQRLGLESKFTKVEVAHRKFEAWICYDKQDASFLDFDSLTDAIGFGSNQP